jgi:hypothetical protein
MKRQARRDAYHDRLFGVPAAARSTPRRRGSWGTFLASFVVTLVLVGIFLLPHLAIAGRHYRVWLIP